MIKVEASGKYIEGVIYEYDPTKGECLRWWRGSLLSGRNLSVPVYSYSISPVHSFIINTNQATIMNLFNEEDQDHITTHNILPDPEIDGEIMEYLQGEYYLQAQ